MAQAKVVFGSDTNRAHFVMDLDEKRKVHGTDITLEEDGSVTFYVFPGVEPDIEELAALYGGEVEWTE